MKIIEIRSLAIPDIKIIRFGRFADNRGYFTELLKLSDFNTLPELSFVKGMKFPQINESFSHKNVVRGLHFQWNPHMGKLVRVGNGHIVDIALDIRKNSPYEGKVVGYEMQTNDENDYQEWIWIPSGFAHGAYFLAETRLVYCCTGEYSPNFERSISPLAEDVDWSMCDPTLKNTIDKVNNNKPIISDKDREGLTLTQWKNKTDSENFIYGKI